MLINLQFGQGSAGTACLYSIWYLLGRLAGWGLESLANFLVLSNAGVCWNISCGCSQNIYIWTLQLLTAWFLASKSDCPKRTEQKLYHLL